MCDQKVTNKWPTETIYTKRKKEKEKGMFPPNPFLIKRKIKEREEVLMMMDARTREKAIEGLIIGSSGAGQI